MPVPHLASAALGLRHVFLHDLQFLAQIGVYQQEHGVRQRIRINVDLAVQDEGALPGSAVRVGTDDLSRVVDYALVVAQVRGLIEAGHVELVETLAERIAEACLTDPRVQRAVVRVEKLDVLPDGASAGVEVERRREV